MCVVMLVSWDGGVAKREHVGEISDAGSPFADAERRVVVLGWILYEVCPKSFRRASEILPGGVTRQKSASLNFPGG
jgi:hypothetical protein